MQELWFRLHTGVMQHSQLRFAQVTNGAVRPGQLLLYNDSQQRKLHLVEVASCSDEMFHLVATNGTKLVVQDTGCLFDWVDTTADKEARPEGVHKKEAVPLPAQGEDY